MAKQDASGALFHAKHAFMPNKLGYCGPDDRGMILEHLRESSVDDNLISTLKKFEAAYPFIRLIGVSSKRDTFDPKVTEAYWIGNKLLGNVDPKDYYNFTLKDLRKKNKEEIRTMFLSLRDRPIPHHTFHVISTTMSIVSDSHHTSSPDRRKLSEVMDSCRISWGRVTKVEKDTLLVRYRPLKLVDGKLALGAVGVSKKVKYDSTVPPFQNVRVGDHVSLHWGFACEILSREQLSNLRTYTRKDMDSANLFLGVLS